MTGLLSTGPSAPLRARTFPQTVEIPQQGDAMRLWKNQAYEGVTS
jgi:hypothetical protein